MPEARIALTADQVAETGAAIVARQRPDGRLPWFTEQHTDAWNHTEAAMGLVIAGELAAAERAFTWLVGAQRPDGSWAESYAWDGTVLSADADINMCAYIAAGVWHHYLHVADRVFVETMWPSVERAIDYVLDHQAPGGEIAWNHHADGTIDRRALLAASSSMYMSVRCAVAIAEMLGEERPDWELSIGLLGHALRHRQDVFWPKKRWSMDWYYPILTTAIAGEDASVRLDVSWSTFVEDKVGCRCVSDQPWVTAAETCELALALDVAGRTDDAWTLFRDIQFLRQDDGAYQEGWVIPDQVHWPGRTPPWTAAAVLLTAEALERRSPAWNLFHGDDLPAGLGAEEIEEHLEAGLVDSPRTA